MAGDGETTLYDLRAVVERIEGRSVCGLQVGDSFELNLQTQHDLDVERDRLGQRLEREVVRRAG